MVNNTALPEGKISARAWGLYAYLSSLPSGTPINVVDLQAVFTEGREAIYSTLHKMLDADLIAMDQYLQQDGLKRKRFITK